MDPALAGWIGVIGACVGVYASLASAKSSAERRFLWLGSAAFCVLIGAHLAAIFLIPQPWNGLSWLVYPPLLIATILWFNRNHAKLRQKSQAAAPCATAGLSSSAVGSNVSRHS